MNLADEIEKRIKALSEAPDSSKGGILLPWKIRAESELTRFLNDQACNIVDALRSAVRPEAGEQLVYWSAADEHGETQHYRCTASLAGELLTKLHKSLGYISGEEKLRLPQGQSSK